MTRDGGGQSGGRGDESFGDARGDGAKSCAAGGAEAVEGVDDTPDCAKSPMKGVTAAVIASQGTLRSRR